jgi:hypothetical protein
MVPRKKNDDDGFVSSDALLMYVLTSANVPTRGR